MHAMDGSDSEPAATVVTTTSLPSCATTDAEKNPVVDYDARYRKGWAYGKAPSPFLAAAAAAHLPVRPLDILSLGEGQGRHVVHLAALGHRCVGVDRSSVGLAKANALAEAQGVHDRVRTVVADLESFDPAADGASWDAVVSIYCAMPADSRRRLHRACERSLRPGGIVIVECFAPLQQAMKFLIY